MKFLLCGMRVSRWEQLVQFIYFTVLFIKILKQKNFLLLTLLAEEDTVSVLCALLNIFTFDWSSCLGTWAVIVVFSDSTLWFENAFILDWSKGFGTLADSVVTASCGFVNFSNADSSNCLAVFSTDGLGTSCLTWLYAATLDGSNCFGVCFTTFWEGICGSTDWKNNSFQI